MDCHHAEREIFAERDAALGATRQAAVLAHVASCPGCRRRRDDLAEAAKSWRRAAQAVATPDPGHEWHAVRRQMRDGSASRRGQHHPLGWLAVPLGAAAAIAVALFVIQPGAISPPSESNRPSAVEVSAGDGSVVFVDEQSGWVVVWEGEVNAQRI